MNNFKNARQLPESSFLLRSSVSGTLTSSSLKSSAVESSSFSQETSCKQKELGLLKISWNIKDLERQYDQKSSVDEKYLGKFGDAFVLSAITARNARHPSIPKKNSGYLSLWFGICIIMYVLTSDLF